MGDRLIKRDTYSVLYKYTNKYLGKLAHKWAYARTTIRALCIKKDKCLCGTLIRKKYWCIVAIHYIAYKDIYL